MPLWKRQFFGRGHGAASGSGAGGSSGGGNDAAQRESRDLAQLANGDWISLEPEPPGPVDDDAALEAFERQLIGLGRGTAAGSGAGGSSGGGEAAGRGPGGSGGDAAQKPKNVKH